MVDLTVPHEFYISTAKESQEIDSRTIHEFGIESFTLMEVAGYRASLELLQDILTPEQKKGLVFCGKGNNAGDALVVARYLLQHGFDLKLYFLSGIDDLSADTQQNLHLLNKLVDHTTDDQGEAQISAGWSNFDPHVKADFIIDGMLGTGLESDLRGDYLNAVSWINESSLPVYAMDIPTGLHGDTGKVMGKSATADYTFSFGTLKQGFYLNDGPSKTGEIIYCELPFPNFLKEDCSSYLLDPAYINAGIKRTARHKYEAGVLYVIAGSEGLTGAAMLAAQSAWAEGIGAVILVCPHGTLEIYEKSLPQIIKKPIGNRTDYYFKEEHLEHTLAVMKDKKGKVLLGPGLGRDKSTQTFVHELLSNYLGDVIIDADGLWCLAQYSDWEKPEESNWILTPHPGELSTLLDGRIKDDFDRLNKTREICSAKNITLVSKGFPVILGTPTGKSYLTAYDTRKFSRAGFGDVLAGKVGAYWSQGYSPLKSSALALLKGKYILEKLLENDSSRIIEPKDFI